MKKVAILLENLFNVEEFVYPYHRLREDFEVHLVSPEKGKVYKSSNGVSFESTHSTSEVSPTDYAGVYIPGGYSPDKMRVNEDLLAFVSALNDAGKPIAAICHGPWVLASAMDLKGKKMTSTKNIKDDLIHAGADWSDEEVVVCGNVVTSRTPKDLPAHVKAFVELLK
ncbi:type 1 glutamine amidotransferase [Peptoniphilus sp. KCTC 25270]|uniref:type 1 glutamine amidotransferase domain-containing protein n=1 Tax=Peptoniphilus sp. KCTC 25270 TaxID=2897414 RepID=UPI001E5FAEF7|nr:type 1 glutamine amidotransferase domain-containing protein [Peptoniphilus sp. KCTC 25270]MCD1147753.1 type 1 glutamine amidotransferase [Peptoniphilus sp. KCTC 25270]